MNVPQYQTWLNQAVYQIPCQIGWLDQSLIPKAWKLHGNKWKKDIIRSTIGLLRHPFMIL